MNSIFTTALLTARALLPNKNIFSPLMATFYVTHTWSDSIFLNFLMKFIFGVFSLGFLFSISPTGLCDNSVGEEPCMVGIINLHQDILVFLLFLFFVTPVIFGYSYYYFKGERGRRNCESWLATEELIRRAPLNAGFTLVGGLFFLAALGLTCYLFPTSSESILQSELLHKPLTNTVDTLLPTARETSVPKPLNNLVELTPKQQRVQKLNAIYNSQFVEVHKTRFNFIYDLKKAAVVKELNSLLPSELSRFGKIDDKVYFYKPIYPEEIKYSVYPSRGTIVDMTTWEVLTPLAAESTDYLLKVSHTPLDTNKINKLIRMALKHSNYKELYLLKYLLNDHSTLNYGVLASLNTPNMTQGNMSNMELYNTVQKAFNIQLYGLDSRRIIVPPRVEFMLNNQYTYLIKPKLLAGIAARDL